MSAVRNNYLRAGKTFVNATCLELLAGCKIEAIVCEPAAAAGQASGVNWGTAHQMLMSFGQR